MNQIQVGLLCVALILLARDEAVLLAGSGFLMGFIVGLKPNLILWPVATFVDAAAQGSFRRIGWLSVGLAMSAVVGIALPAGAFGDVATWRGWQEMMTQWYPNYRWYARSSFLRMTFGIRNPGAFRVASLVSASIVILAAFRSGLEQQTDWGGFETRLERAVLLSGVAVGAFMFSAPLVHGHYALLMIPLLALLMRPGLPGTAYFTPQRWLGTASIVMLSAHPFLRHFGFTDELVTPTPVFYFGVAIPVVLGLLRLVGPGPYIAALA